MPVPQISVEGRIVGDVQFKFTDEGMAVARFRMVASDRKQVNGEWVESDDKFWVTVTAFRKMAENVADSLRDRDAVVVVGKLTTPEWVADDGSKRSGLKLIASSVGPSLFFLPRQHHESDRAGGSRPARPQVPARADDREAWAPREEDPWVTPVGGGTLPADDPWA